MGFHHSNVLDFEQTPCCDSSSSSVFCELLAPQTPLHYSLWLCSPWLDPSRFLDWSILLVLSCCSPGPRKAQISLYHFLSQTGSRKTLDLVNTAVITPSKEAKSGLRHGIVCPECTFPSDRTACLMSTGSREAHTWTNADYQKNRWEITPSICFIHTLRDSILPFPWQ